jgi:O-antigen/teichoic acid export membrane protein
MSLIRNWNRLKKSVLQNETFAHSLNYLTNSFARKGLTLISIPIFTYLLSPADYGILNVFSANVELAAILFTLNGSVGVGRYYFEKDTIDFESLLFTSLIFSFLGLLIFGFLTSWQSAWLSGIIDLPVDIIKFIVPAAVLIVLSNYMLSVFRAAGKSKVIRNFGIQKTYVEFVLSVSIMLLLSNDIFLGRIWSSVAASVIFGSIAIWKLSYYMKPRFEPRHLVYLLSYSLPLLPAYLGALVLSYFDRMMLNNMVSEESAGLYSFAYNIAGLQYMISNALMNAWVPRYYKQMNSANFEELDKQGVRIFKIISIATVGLMAFGQYLGMVLGSSAYYDGLVIVPIIVLGQFFVTFSVFYKNSISFSKKTIYSTIAILISALVNISLNYLFIPQFGMVAAAWTTLAAYVIQGLLMMILVRTFLSVHSMKPTLLLPTVGFTVLTGGVLWIVNMFEFSIFLSILIKSIVLIIVSYMLFKTKSLSIIKQIKNLI